MQVHPGQLYEAKFFAHNLHRPRDLGAGRAEHRAVAGHAVFPQDRVLLLHAAAVRGGRRRATCRCASSSTRRCRSTSTASRSPTLSTTRKAPVRTALITGTFRASNMSTHTETHDASQVLHSAQQPLADLGSIALFTLMCGVVSLLNDWAAGWALLPGALLLIVPVRRLVRHRHRREPAGIYNLDVDRSFRMGMMWFIFSEVHVLRGVLRRAVLCARAVGAVAGRRGREDLQQAAAVAGLRRGLAHQRPGR